MKRIPDANRMIILVDLFVISSYILDEPTISEYNKSVVYWVSVPTDIHDVVFLECTNL